MSKAIVIDAEKREVRAVDIETDLKWMQEQVKGSIEWAWTGDRHTRTFRGCTMYVNGDGMSEFTYGFQFAYRPDQPLWGNAVVVGPEVGNDGHHADIDTSPSALEFWRGLVRFVDLPKN